MRRPLRLLTLALLAVAALVAQVALQLAGRPLPGWATALFDLALLGLVLWAAAAWGGPDGTGE